LENANQIKILRNHLGLSQTDFGKKLGVSRDVINNIENNRVPLKPTIAKLICSEFQVDPHWLETGEGEKFQWKSENDALLDFAVQMFTNKDLQWIKRLCTYVNALSAEERAVVAKYAEEIAGVICEKKEKEQE